MDEYAPEEESALKLRAVGRVQEGVRATVRMCVRLRGRLSESNACVGRFGLGSINGT